MVFIPVFYVAQKRSGTKQYFYVSDKPKTDMTKHPGSGKYIGRYHMNSNGYSATGYSPYVNMTRANVRNKAKSVGSKFHLYDFATYCAIIFLYIVEFANWNCQSKIGQGYTNNNNSSAISSGRTDSMTYHTGRASSTDGKTAVQYRWIENLWGNVRQWVDGFNANGTTAYYCTDPSKYADDTSTGYTEIGTLPASGYIKDLIVTDNGLLIPKTTGGSETTYIPDYMWSSSGWRVLYVGGNWNNGTNAGLLYFNANNTSSNSNSNISARLLSNSIIIAQAFPHPLVKIMPRGRELVGHSNALAGNKDVITIPKRVGFLYEKMLDRAFITETIRLVANGKKKRRSVRRVLANIDAYAEKLLVMLQTDSFIPSKPKVKRVYDVSSRKWRDIKVVPFYPDGCVH